MGLNKKNGFVLWLTGMGSFLQCTYSNSKRYDDQNYDCFRELLHKVGHRLSKDKDLDAEIPDGEDILILHGACNTLIIGDLTYTPERFARDLTMYSPTQIIFLRAPRYGRQYHFRSIAEDFGMSFISQQMPQILYHPEFKVEISNSTIYNNNGDVIHDISGKFNNTHKHDYEEKESKKWYEHLMDIAVGFVKGIATNACCYFSNL